MLDSTYIALFSLVMSSAFIYFSYKISLKTQEYFNPQSSIFLALFLAMAGYFNGSAWYNLSSTPNIVFMLFGFGLEYVKPVLIKYGSRTRMTWFVIIFLAVFSVGSSTTMLYKNLNDSNYSFANQQNEAMAQKNDMSYISNKTNPYIKSSKFSTKSDSDLTATLANLQKIKGVATDGKTQPQTIWVLTNNCKNTNSMYFPQQNVCRDVIELSTELETRKNYLVWEQQYDADRKNVNTKKPQLISSEQKDWVVMMTYIRSIFNPDIMTQMPKSEVELIEYYNQSSQSSKLIAVFVGVLLESLLLILSYNTYYKPSANDRSLKLQAIVDTIKTSNNSKPKLKEKDAVKKTSKRRKKQKVDFDKLKLILVDTRLSGEKILTIAKLKSTHGIDLSAYEFYKLKSMLIKDGELDNDGVWK